MEPGHKSHGWDKMASSSSVLEKRDVKRYTDDTIPLTCTVVGVKPFQSYVVSILASSPLLCCSHFFQVFSFQFNCYDQERNNVR